MSAQETPKLPPPPLWAQPEPWKRPLVLAASLALFYALLLGDSGIGLALCRLWESTEAHCWLLLYRRALLTLAFGLLLLTELVRVLRGRCRAAEWWLSFVFSGFVWLQILLLNTCLLD